MESGGGSTEPCPECGRPYGRGHKLDCKSGRKLSPENKIRLNTLVDAHRDRMRKRIHDMVERDRALNLGPQPGELTADEADAIANGEPYCFRCGKPASSFSAYDAHLDHLVTSRADAVRQEEGTYNPNTNRFACDACYIAIGQPADNEAGGWRAP